MITPGPGYIVDPNNPNAVIRDQNAQVNPFAPNSPSIAFGAVNTPESSPQKNTQVPTVASLIAPPDNKQQQVAKIQQDFQVLQKKYQDFYNTQKGKPAPDQNPMRSEEVQQNLQTNQDNLNKSDPQQNFFDEMAGMNPVMKQMYDMVNQMMSPQMQQQSFAQEYQNIIASQGIPGLQTDLLNAKRIMDGTEDDIRNEITKAGGFATESQVQAMSATRNKVLLKNANYLSQTLQMKEDYVNQIMQFSQADRFEVDKQVEQKLGLVEKMATIQDTMNKNATTNYNKIVDNLGYTGLAKTFENNPQMSRKAENLLGLPQGVLSDPDWVAQADTLKQRQLGMTQQYKTFQEALAQSKLEQAQQKINITIAQQGAGGAGSGALQGMLDVYNTTGQVPSFGYGAAGQGMRKAFYAAIGGEGSAGIAQAASNKAMLAGSTAAARNQQVQLSATKTSLATLDKQLDLLKSYSDKVDRSGSPVLNKYILWTKGEVKGDADTQALQNIVTTASSEFAKILSGSAASISGTTVSSAEEAKKLINANMTPAQLNKIISLMKKEGNYRISSQEETLRQIHTDIKSLGQSGDLPNKIVSYNGKKYQVDADGNFDINKPL